MKRNSYTVMSQGAQQQLTKLAVVEAFVVPKTESLAHISLPVLETLAVLKMHCLQYKASTTNEWMKTGRNFGHGQMEEE